MGLRCSESQLRLQATIWPGFGFDLLASGGKRGAPSEGDFGAAEPWLMMFDDRHDGAFAGPSRLSRRRLRARHRRRHCQPNDAIGEGSDHGLDFEAGVRAQPGLSRPKRLPGAAGSRRMGRLGLPEDQPKRPERPLRRQRTAKRRKFTRSSAKLNPVRQVARPARVGRFVNLTREASSGSSR